MHVSYESWWKGEVMTIRRKGEKMSWNAIDTKSGNREESKRWSVNCDLLTSDCGERTSIREGKGRGRVIPMSIIFVQEMCMNISSKSPHSMDTTRVITFSLVSKSFPSLRQVSLFPSFAPSSPPLQLVSCLCQYQYKQEIILTIKRSTSSLFLHSLCAFEFSWDNWQSEQSWQE